MTKAERAREARREAVAWAFWRGVCAERARALDASAEGADFKKRYPNIAAWGAVDEAVERGRVMSANFRRWAGEP